MAADPDLRTVIMDPRSGFHELLETFGVEAEKVTIGGKKSLNILDIHQISERTSTKFPDMDPYTEKLETLMDVFHVFLDDTDNWDIKRAVLWKALQLAYKSKGITRKIGTHSETPPIMSDVRDKLADLADDPREHSGDDRMSEQEVSDWKQAASGLRTALHPFEPDGTLGHLGQQTEIDGLEPDSDTRLILLDLQQYEGGGKLPLMMKIIFDKVYQAAKALPKLNLIVDEAHHLLQNPEALDWLETAFRFSRHFKLSINLLTHSAEEFFVDPNSEEDKPNPKAKLIADMCTILVMLRTPGLSVDHGEMLGLTPKQTAFVRNCQAGDRDLGYSHALLSVEGQGTVPMKVEAISDTEMDAVDPPDPDPGDPDGSDELDDFEREIFA